MYETCLLCFLRTSCFASTEEAEVSNENKMLWADRRALRSDSVINALGEIPLTIYLNIIYLCVISKCNAKK